MCHKSYIVHSGSEQHSYFNFGFETSLFALFSTNWQFAFKDSEIMGYFLY